MLGVHQEHEPHCCVNDRLHYHDYIIQAAALPSKSHQAPVQTHRASCIAKKCDKAVNHMGEVIYLMSRLHAQVQSLKSLFLGVMHQIDQQSNQYHNQPSYSEITHKLKTATSPGERARIKVEARRQRLAARRACFQPKETATGGISQSELQNVQLTQSPIRKIERYGDDRCLIEYDDTAPSTGPGTPQLVVSDDMATSKSRLHYDASKQQQESSYTRSARLSPYVSAVGKMGTDKHEDTSVWATLVNELTKEWKNSGTPIALLRYAQTSHQLARGKSGTDWNSETHVTLSEISKITSIPDVSSAVPKCSTSDILGPLHSTMIDIADVKLEPSDDLFARNYTVHSVDTESTASSMDLRYIDPEVMDNDSSAYSNGLPGISVNSGSYMGPVPVREESHFPLLRTSHEIIGASFIENNMAKKTTNHSMEATCASTPDCGDITVPDTDISQSPLDSTREKSSSHSAIQSSYKESDLFSSDSSIHESDLEILQPKFKKPVGRPKRVQRSNIRPTSDTDESHNDVSVPLNTPDLTGSSNASKPQGDFVINNTKSNDNIINLDLNNLSPSQESILDHTRPPCIGKLNTPAYQPIVVKNKLFNNIMSDTDSGIGERPPCIGRSETPLNINVRGRILKFESDDENDTESDSLDNQIDNMDNNNSLILGDRPACLGKSMMEINHHLPKSMMRPKSYDVDSGVSMSALSPVVHLRNKKAPIPTRKPSSHQPKSRLHIGCVSSRADQTSEFSEEIEVLESQLVTKPNKKSLSRKLKNFGGIFNRNKKDIKM